MNLKRRVSRQGGAGRRIAVLSGLAGLLLTPFLWTAQADAAVTGKGLNKTAWQDWENYQQRFLVTDPNGNTRVVDPQGGDRTTSEGQSYAMFFALVANRRDVFDRLLSWTTANLAQGDMSQHLPAWLWGHDKDGSWRALDPNSASDSDLWIAYDLASAGQLWNEPRYTKLSRQMLQLIAAHDVASVPGFGAVLLPAEQGFLANGVAVMNPSYMPPFVLTRLAVLDPKGPWKQLAAQTAVILQKSSRKGYAMDWVSYIPNAGLVPSGKTPNVQPESGLGSYEAIRVYLWAGMTDKKDPNYAGLFKAIGGMNSPEVTKGDAPPEKVNAQGIPVSTTSPVGFSGALLPYLAAYNNDTAVKMQQARILGERDGDSGLYGKGPDGKTPAYYDQNLVMFGLGWTEHRFRFGADGKLIVSWRQA